MIFHLILDLIKNLFSFSSKNLSSTSKLDTSVILFLLIINLSKIQDILGKQKKISESKINLSNLNRQILFSLCFCRAKPYDL